MVSQGIAQSGIRSPAAGGVLNDSQRALSHIHKHARLKIFARAGKRLGLSILPHD